MTETHVYKTADIANILGVGTSTIRRYAIEIENKGGIFPRNEHNARIYTQSELNAFKRLRKLLDEGNTLEQAAEIIASYLNESKDERKAAGEMVAQSDRELFTSLIDEIKALRGEVAELKSANEAEQVKQREAFLLAINEVKRSHAEELRLIENEKDSHEADDKGGLFKRLFKRK